MGCELPSEPGDDVVEVTLATVSRVEGGGRREFAPQEEGMGPSVWCTRRPAGSGLFLGRDYKLCSRVCVGHSIVPDSWRPHGRQSTRLLCPWSSPGKNFGVGCHAFLQGIFLIRGLNPGLLHCRQILRCLSHQGSPMESRL